MIRWHSILLGAGILGLDLWSKSWAKSALDHNAWPIIDGFFRLRYVQNEGIAFGLLHSFESSWKPAILSLAALLALGIVFHYIWSTPASERRLFLAFGLLTGGILGNFTDRIFNGFVVDFLELHWRESFIWPTFNVADAAITCGVALILLDTFFSSSQEAASDSAPATETASPEAGATSQLTASCALCLALLPGAAHQNPSPVGQLVESLQQRYDQVQSISAHFRQVSEDRGITQQEEGTLLMKRPGRMRWEYRQPTPKLFVADGQKTFFYNIEQKQVVESELDLQGRGSPLFFLMGRGRILSDFEAGFEESEKPLGKPSNRLIRLTPLPSQIEPEYEYLLLEVEPESLQIQRLSVIDPIGNRNDYILSQVKENLPIAEKQFRFKIPKGVERIVQ